MKLFKLFLSSILLKSVSARNNLRNLSMDEAGAEPPSTTPVENKHDISTKRWLQDNNGNNSDSGDMRKEAAADQIYHHLMQLFDVPEEQVVVMEFPGRVFDESRFSYNTTSDYSVATKPQFVAEAEFQLTNDLFDVDFNASAHVVASPNGEKLSDVYELALSNLVPKIVGSDEEGLYNDQKKLRSWLYEFVTEPYGHDEMYKGSRMGFTTLLYERYAAAKIEWTQEKYAMREKAEKKTIASERELAFNDYAEYIATVGFAKEENITARYNDLVVLGEYHKVNNAISILDIETEASVFQKLKSKLRQTAMLSFDETETIYPVQIQPDDWFKYLTTDFSPRDLLLDPDAVKMELISKTKLAAQLRDQINTLQSTPTSNETLAQLQNDVNDAQTNLDDAKNDLLKNLNQATYQLINIAYRSYCQKNNIDPKTGKVDDNFTKEAAEQEAGAESSGIPITQDDIDAFRNYTDKEIGLQTQFQTASRQLSAVLEKQAEAESTQTRTQVANLQSQLNILNAAILELEEQVNSGASLTSQHDAMYNFTNHTNSSEMLPDAPTVDGFFDVVMHFDKKDDRQKSNMKAGSSQTSVDVDTFFGSFSYSSSSEYSDFSQNHTTSDTTFQIGFRATKIDFVRDWFSPEVFHNTQNMYHLNKKGYTFNTVFPQSAIIAKDVTIKIEFDESTTQMANSILKSSSGESGGIFCFGASHSQSSDQQSKSFYSGSASNGVIIKIPGPQVLLWILEKIPEDESEPYPTTGVITDEFMASLG